jgi:hypothetical protein
MMPMSDEQPMMTALTVPSAPASACQLRPAR